LRGIRGCADRLRARAGRRAPRSDNDPQEGGCVTVTRRKVIHSAAWSIPVIAAAVAVPLAAASEPPRIPVSCEKLNQQGQPHYMVTYNDGTSEIYDNGTVNSNKELKALCR